MKKIITKTLDITPDMAAQMLERNTMNRNISQLNVTRYANDMASGAWEQNGETIKIAEDGTILDGQHRLWAIIESGVTVTMIVVYNVRKEAVGSIDSGVTRLFHHLLKIKGSQHPTTAAMITKFAWITRTLIGRCVQVRQRRKPVIRFWNRIMTRTGICLNMPQRLRNAARIIS